MKTKMIIIGLLLSCIFGCSKEGPCPDKSGFKGEKPPNGSELWCEKNTEDGESVLHGPFSSWHTADQKKSEGQYVDGEKDGKWTEWYGNGNKEREGSFNSGSRVGVWTSWHKKGQKTMSGEYKDDKREGVWSGWYKTGEKKDEGEWKNGQPCGKWTYYYKNGNKRKEGQRDEMGECTGPWVIYYEDGKKKEEGVYEKDKKIGIWKTWDKEGVESAVDMSAESATAEETPKKEAALKVNSAPTLGTANK